MKHFLFFATFFALSASSSFSQTGIIKFAVDVDNGYFEILINDTLLLKQYKDTLPAGDYSAVVWSPTYVAQEIDFKVTEGMDAMLHVKMVRSDEYLTYAKSQAVFYKKKQSLVKRPAIISSMLTIGTATSFIWLMQKDKQRQELLLNYDNMKEVLKLNNYKDEYETVENHYNLARTFFYVGTGLTLASIITSVFTIRNFNQKFKHNRPVYSDGSPWQDRFSINVGVKSCSLKFVL